MAPLQENNNIMDYRRYGKSSRRISTDRRRALSIVKNDYTSQLLKLEQSEKAKSWLRSFTSLDPRLQILHFFNDLALEGVDNYERRESDVVASSVQTPKLLRGFAKSGMFTVWRPTSPDAIRKMITGEGTGKGLDIKGKSALKGPYSGFVPFLQISENDHKEEIGSLHLHKRVRVFYATESARDEAFSRLAKLSRSMLGNSLMRSTSTKQQRRRMRSTVTDMADMMTGMTTDLMTDLHLMNDPKVYKIDDYATANDNNENGEGVYGIDVPEKLLWEGYVMPADISRPEGSKYDTGRQSMPAFQQMNIDTLQSWKGENLDPSSASSDKEADPRPVLWHAPSSCGDSEGEDEDYYDPLCPQGLLMAYEEDGKVTPVVSDFDCFLLGTRGVKYEKPFRDEELSMLSWCIEEIHGILSTPKEEEGSASWTSRWLEVKKKLVQAAAEDGCQHEMPKFGYADPRSYSIIKGAVNRLKGNGAVRHGPECFNYAFPQELDNRFLVVSDTFPGVPWRYVGPEDLINILSDKIDEGFTFPLNPKWVLCDPGWKRLYDKLLASQMPNVQDSMNIWYPSEIRTRMEDISTNFPNGFDISNSSSKSLTSQISTHDKALLAEYELAKYRENYRGSNWKMKCRDFVSLKTSKMKNSATKMTSRVPKMKKSLKILPKVGSNIFKAGNLATAE